MPIQPDQSASPPPGVVQFFVGASCVIAAVAIWAGWLVMMRLGVTTRLPAPDLTALRFATAGLVLLPIVLRRGFAIDYLAGRVLSRSCSGLAHRSHSSSVWRCSSRP